MVVTGKCPQDGGDEGMSHDGGYEGMSQDSGDCECHWMVKTGSVTGWR